LPDKSLSLMVILSIQILQGSVGTHLRQGRSYSEISQWKNLENQLTLQ